ncbi:MAG: PepSY domain-containing protein [Gammaproteobacteria bacterium]
MARFVPILTLLVVTWAALGAAVPVQAAGPGHEPSQSVRAAVSPGRAVAEAEARTGGRVLAVETSDSGGEPVYRIKVLTPRGRVRVLIMDARTGKWLR